MTFPLNIFDQTFEDAPSFAEAVLSDAMVGGGRFDPDAPPHQWIKVKVDEGVLERSLVVGLTAWLARNKHPAAISEAVRIATSLSLNELVPVFAAGLEGFSLGVLLQPDPCEPQQSIEDLVLKAVAGLMDGSDAEMRADLLIHLRNAGLREQEVSLMLNFGSIEELEIGLPAIFVETLPKTEAVVKSILRGPTVAITVANCLHQAPIEYRQLIWDQAIAKAPLIAQNNDFKAALFNEAP